MGSAHAITDEDCWRAIILRGRNVAAYKFALGHALIELTAQEHESVTLEELALPFARHVCRHLANHDRQATSRSSTFLDACRAHNRGEISEDELRERTVRLGFQNVIDAFHVVGPGPVPVRFFDDERATNSGIRLRPEIHALREGGQFGNLAGEVEARWALVEHAWELGMAPELITVEYEHDGQLLVPRRDLAGRRPMITGSRAALDGYQRGRCFYCDAPISIDPSDDGLADVDHFLPRALARSAELGNLDGVWNLVLACRDCNRGRGGKHASVPAEPYLGRLHARNENLIASHHPLRETLVLQTGANERVRRRELRSRWNAARRLAIHAWSPGSG